MMKGKSTSCQVVKQLIAIEHVFPYSVTDQSNFVLKLFDVSEDEVGKIDLGNLDVGVGRPHDKLLFLWRDLRHFVFAAYGN